MTKFRFCWIFSWSVVFFGLYTVKCPAQQADPGEKRRSADYYYRVGEVQMEKQDWGAARNAFNTCLRINHLFYDAYYSRAVVHEHLDSLNKAVTDYNIYLEFKPVHHEALFGRAQVRMRLNQYQLAKEDLLKALSIPPGETTAIFFRQDVNSGLVDKMFTSHSAQGHTYNALGVVDTWLENYEEALVYFDSALLAMPNDPEVLANRKTAYEKKYGKSVTVDSLGSFAERAYNNFEKGNYHEALSDYNKAIEQEPTEPAYYINRGLIKEMLHDNNAAYNDYTSAIRLNNNSEKALLNRGNLLTKQGKLNEAIDDYTAAIGHYPNYASAYFNRAVARKRLQQKDLACEDLKAAQRLGLPIDPKVWKNICGN